MKRIRRIAMAIIIFWLVMISLALNVKADEFYRVKSTAYCYNSGKTATETVPKEGRTLAGKREWFGKTAIVWEDRGNGIEPQNYIGTFICEDTGGESVRKGYVIDIFIKDYDRAIEYGNKDVIIQLIEADG